MQLLREVTTVLHVAAARRKRGSFPEQHISWDTLFPHAHHSFSSDVIPKFVLVVSDFKIKLFVCTVTNDIGRFDAAKYEDSVPRLWIGVSGCPQGYDNPLLGCLLKMSIPKVVLTLCKVERKHESLRYLCRYNLSLNQSSHFHNYELCFLSVSFT